MSDVRRPPWQIKNRLRRSADHFIVGPLLVGLMRRRCGAATSTAASIAWGACCGGWTALARASHWAAKPGGGISREVAGALKRSCSGLGEPGSVRREFANLDRQGLRPSGRRLGRIEAGEADADRFTRLSQSGKPILVFAAHLGNWELAPLGATAHGLKVAVLYRAPSVSRVATAVRGLRAEQMGLLIPTGPDAPFKAAGALERGTSVGMLVDQHSIRGAEVELFGRRCMANTMIARLARQLECPIHGTARSRRYFRLASRTRAHRAIPPPRAPPTAQHQRGGTMKLIPAKGEAVRSAVAGNGWGCTAGGE
jgi:hypothetical protein